MGIFANVYRTTGDIVCENNETSAIASAKASDRMEAGKWTISAPNNLVFCNDRLLSPRPSPTIIDVDSRQWSLTFADSHRRAEICLQLHWWSYIGDWRRLSTIDHNIIVGDSRWLSVKIIIWSGNGFLKVSFIGIALLSFISELLIYVAIHVTHSYY